MIVSGDAALLRQRRQNIADMVKQGLLRGDTSAYEAAVDQITKAVANGSLSAEEGQTALNSLRFSLGNNQIIPGEASSAIQGLADLGGRNLKRYLASVGSTFTKDPISSYPSLG
jgi:hypothetical protein